MPIFQYDQTANHIELGVDPAARFKQVTFSGAYSSVIVSARVSPGDQEPVWDASTGQQLTMDYTYHTFTISDVRLDTFIFDVTASGIFLINIQTWS